MDNKELVALFTGYGYQVRIVEDINDIDTDLHYSIAWAVDEIHKIQHAARSGKPILKPRWPMLVLRTPKVSLSKLYLKEPIGLSHLLGVVRAKATQWPIHRRLFPFPPGTSAKCQDRQRAIGYITELALQL